MAERVGWRGEMRYGLLTDVRAPDESLITHCNAMLK